SRRRHTIFSRDWSSDVCSSDLMKVEALPVIEGNYNLQNYDEMYANFNWSEAEKSFSWYETGRVNMAYEAIDRHTETFRKNKVARSEERRVGKECRCRY